MKILDDLLLNDGKITLTLFQGGLLGAGSLPSFAMSLSS